MSVYRRSGLCSIRDCPNAIERDLIVEYFGVDDTNRTIWTNTFKHYAVKLFPTLEFLCINHFTNLMINEDGSLNISHIMQPIIVETDSENMIDIQSFQLFIKDCQIKQLREEFIKYEKNISQKQTIINSLENIIVDVKKVLSNFQNKYDFDAEARNIFSRIFGYLNREVDSIQNRRRTASRFLKRIRQKSSKVVSSHEYKPKFAMNDLIIRPVKKSLNEENKLKKSSNENNKPQKQIRNVKPSISNNSNLTGSLKSTTIAANKTMQTIRKQQETKCPVLATPSNVTKTHLVMPSESNVTPINSNIALKSIDDFVKFLIDVPNVEPQTNKEDSVMTVPSVLASHLLETAKEMEDILSNIKSPIAVTDTLLPVSSIAGIESTIGGLSSKETTSSRTYEIQTKLIEKTVNDKSIPSSEISEHIQSNSISILPDEIGKQITVDLIANENIINKQLPIVSSDQKDSDSNLITATNVGTEIEATKTLEKTREEILAEREQKKQAKAARKIKADPSETNVSVKVVEKVGESDTVNTEKQKVFTTKAERRAKQEAQRAAKASKSSVAITDVATSPMEKIITKPVGKPVAAFDVNDKQTKVSTTAVTTVSTKGAGVGLSDPVLKLPLHKVKLFNHLYMEKRPITNLLINSDDLHPAIMKLGSQYANRIVVGSNARCIAFMNAMRTVIEEYKTPAQKEYARGLESTIQLCVKYLHQCRPLAVSITNAIKHIKWQITQFPQDDNETLLRERLIESIDTYIRDQIEKAALAISISVQDKISDGDVILTFGCSSLIKHILEEAINRKANFRVIVVDARPEHEGQEMLRRLIQYGIKCTCVLINAIGFIMPEVTKVLLGAHALLANGYVMSRAGTAQVALVANAYNVPVLVCCETHKFSERVQTDAFVYNEIGNPNGLVLNSGTQENLECNPLLNWENNAYLTPLLLSYDVTPPELVTAVITEIAILPCTSVPVILRIKPTESGY